MSKEEAILTDESAAAIDEKEHNANESSHLNEVDSHDVGVESGKDDSSVDNQQNESLGDDLVMLVDDEKSDVEITPNEKEPAPVIIEKKPSKGGVIFVFFLIVLVGGAGSAGGYYFWQQQQKQVGILKQQAGSIRQQTGSIQQQNDSIQQQNNSIQQQNKSIQQQNNSIQQHESKIQQQAGEIQKQAQLITLQQQSISTLQSQLDSARSKFKNGIQLSSENAQQIKSFNEKMKQSVTMSQRAVDVVNRNQRDWALAEVNYLLRMAHQRLIVAKDIDSAVAALKGADERLEQLGDLALFKVRKQLSSDIGALSSIPKADINGVALGLDQAIASLQSLPFITAKQELKGLIVEKEISTLDTQEENVLTEEPTILQRIIDAVKELGDIKVHQRSVKTATSSDNQSNIEHMLRMHLLAARLAALQFEQKQFVYELNEAIKLLDANYDGNDNRIQQLQTALTDYTELQLSPELPELTTAWSLLQAEIKKSKEIMSGNNSEEKTEL